MKFVKNYDDIKANLSTLDKYLGSKIDPKYTFALNLIKKGTCFLVIEEDEGYMFYPSRFIGYKNNTMENHLNNDEKDGRETNPVISTILGLKLEKDAIMDIEYKRYCEKLGFVANEKGSFGVERKFWVVK